MSKRYPEPYRDFYRLHKVSNGLPIGFLALPKIMFLTSAQKSLISLFSNTQIRESQLSHSILWLTILQYKHKPIMHIHVLQCSMFITSNPVPVLLTSCDCVSLPSCAFLQACSLDLNNLVTLLRNQNSSDPYAMLHLWQVESQNVDLSPSFS